MTSKFELSISTSYVPDWGVVEAFRELFQNALDNQTINPENEMGWEYNGETVTISNKTSKLSVESLLLGNGTKHEDERTIGKHGEGYKIAFMVLLRNNKKIKVYNYGAKEIWEVRLVNSKRYNGQKIPTVFVEKEAIWKKTPSSDLIIEVSGVSVEEYMQVKDKNLHLRPESVKKFSFEDKGEILLNEEESGNIYVNGLFVSHKDSLDYGYNFDPKVLNLDRDRRLVDTFNVQWQTSILWNRASKEDEELKKVAVKLINKNSSDTYYVKSTSGYFGYDTELLDAVAEDFYEEYGSDAVPVTNNTDYKLVERSKEGKPVIVSENKAEIIKKSSIIKEHVEIEVKDLKTRFEDFLSKIEGKLSDDELEEFRELIEEIDT